MKKCYDYNSEWMSPSSLGGGITGLLSRGDNPLLSYTLREGAKRQWRLLCTDRSETEKRSNSDRKISENEETPADSYPTGAIMKNLCAI